MGGRRKIRARTNWTNEKGFALVGKTITVAWPFDSTYYNSLVLDFFPDLNRHKILYLADESLETLELGHGPSQREFHDTDQQEDRLVGKDVVLNDRELGQNDEGGEEWFHFMRPSTENLGDRFAVTVVAALNSEDVDFEEVSGPRKADGGHRYYRVIYLPNEYLATIDLAATDYNIVARESPPIEEENEYAPEPNVEDEVEKKDVEEEYEPPENVDVADEQVEDDTIIVERERRVVVDRVRVVEHIGGDRKAASADPAPVLAYDDENDIDIDKVAKVVSADHIMGDDIDEPSTDVRVAVDDAIDSLSTGRVEAEVRTTGEGSIGTQDTRDDSLDPRKTEKKRPPPPKPSALFPMSFDDEEGNVTASDDGKNGWGAAKSEESSKLKVGDYISLHTGMGVPRKAFVEAYLPTTGTHFVAFCDARGGNLQIKLTKENHTVLGDDEVDRLARSKKDESVEPLAVAEEEVPKKRKRRTRSPTKTKSRKRSVRTPDIKGQVADEKICGHCISIVWPVEHLVYVALVLGYSSHSKEHQIVYMVDHCVETLDLRYREWSLLPRDKEPWISTGMVGKRLYVFWDGSYDDDESQALATAKFGDKTKVPYEAYVLSYLGDGKYKIIYTATEDTETRELQVEEDKELAPTDKEWDLLEDGVRSVDELPLIGWTD